MAGGRLLRHWHRVSLVHWRSLIHFDAPDLLHNVLGPVVDSLVDPLSCPALCLHYKPTNTCWRLPVQARETVAELKNAVICNN
jgi:hypothetical protein